MSPMSGVKEGTVFQWTDSFCSRMALGLGPRIAPRAQNIPSYSGAPINGQVPIGAYIGVSLVIEEGELFGTLCAIDPSPKQVSIKDELPSIEKLARVLSTVLASDLRATAQKRHLERAQRFGASVCVIVLDLDNLKRLNDSRGRSEGDALIARTAGVIRSVVRERRGRSNRGRRVCSSRGRL